LEKQKPLPPLEWNSLLYMACRDHTKDIGPKGLTTIKGTDGSMPTDRIARYGILESKLADSCIFSVISPLEALERLIVCDGQKQRGFRKAIFSKEFKYCGVSCGLHSRHENIIQLLYVCEIYENDEKKNNKSYDQEMKKNSSGKVISSDMNEQ